MPTAGFGVYQIPDDQTQAAVEAALRAGYRHPTLVSIGEAHGTSVAQVVLRWLTQRGIAVVSKSVRADRMAANLDIFEFTLTADEMARIASLETGGSLFFDHRDPAMVSWLGARRYS